MLTNTSLSRNRVRAAPGIALFNDQPAAEGGLHFCGGLIWLRVGSGNNFSKSADTTL
jgi:hypothetical protein